MANHSVLTNWEIIATCNSQLRVSGPNQYLSGFSPYKVGNYGRKFTKNAGQRHHTCFIDKLACNSWSNKSTGWCTADSATVAKTVQSPSMIDAVQMKRARLTAVAVKALNTGLTVTLSSSHMTSGVQGTGIWTLAIWKYSVCERFYLKWQ